MSAALDHGVGHPVTAALAETGSCLAGVSEVSLWSLSEAELPELVIAAGQVVARAQGLLARLAGEMDARELATRSGAPNMRAWLRHRLRLSPGEAARVMRVAGAADHAAEGAVGAGLSAGELTLEQAAVIARAVSELPDEVGPQVRADAQAHLIGLAAEFDAVTLAIMGRHILAVVAPGTLEDVEGRQLAAAEARAARRRELVMSPDGQAACGYAAAWTPRPPRSCRPRWTRCPPPARRGRRARISAAPPNDAGTRWSSWPAEH